jgi:hypothetical protein
MAIITMEELEHGMQMSLTKQKLDEMALDGDYHHGRA